MNAAGDVPLDNSITPEGKYQLLSYWYHKELGKINQTLQHITVVDPGFPRGGANSSEGCTNLLFHNFFAENWMKMKEFGPRFTVIVSNFTFAHR